MTAFKEFASRNRHKHLTAQGRRVAASALIHASVGVVSFCPDVPRRAHPHLDYPTTHAIQKLLCSRTSHAWPLSRSTGKSSWASFLSLRSSLSTLRRPIFLLSTHGPLVVPYSIQRPASETLQCCTRPRSLRLRDRTLSSA